MLKMAHATFSNLGAAENATLKGSGTYDLGSVHYVLENAHFTFDATSQATVKHKFINSSVQNDCEYVHRVDNAANTLTAIIAAGGDIMALNKAEHTLQELKIGASLTVGAYKGSALSAANEAVIKVAQLAVFGQGATLNADLVMQTGAELKMDGTLTMGSDVRLEEGLTLSGELYNMLLAENEVVLIQGIDNLYLGAAPEPVASITADDRILAHLYFTNLSPDYLLVYNVTEPGNGILKIAAIPEPSSATLSLLALAALVARRRR